MVAIRNYLTEKLKQKGQGIVEYALLLAFIVGIAMMLNGVGLKDAVVGVFDDVANVLAGFTDSRSPEEKDRANMELLANAMAEGFDVTNNGGITVDPISKKVKMPSTWMGIVVYADGTIDVAMRDNGWSNNRKWLLASEWEENSLGTNDEQKFKERYNLVMNTLENNTGVDFKDSSTVSQKFKINSEQYSNGYMLVYDKWTEMPTVRAVALPSGVTSTLESSARKEAIEQTANVHDSSKFEVIIPRS